MSEQATNEAEAMENTADKETTQTGRGNGVPKASKSLETSVTIQAPELDDESKQKLADFDNLKSRAEMAESRLRVLEAKDAFTESAAKLKARNPAKVFALVGAQIEFDAQGKPKNLDDVLKRAKERFPEEFGVVSTSIDAGEKGVETVGRSVDDFIRGALR